MRLFLAIFEHTKEKERKVKYKIYGLFIFLFFNRVFMAYLYFVFRKRGEGGRMGCVFIEIGRRRYNR